MPRGTRGRGLLEGLLARLRARMAMKLIPAAARSGAVLDIGCGSYPTFLASAARAGYSRRVGVDKFAQADAAPPGVDLVNFDLTSGRPLPFGPGEFQAVTMLAVAEHLPRAALDGLVAECARVLAPGGVLVLTTPAAHADGLLRLMARVGLVSAEEIDEHQTAFTRESLGELLREAGGTAAWTEVRCGSFEMGLNLWAVGFAPAGPRGGVERSSRA